MKFMVTFTHIDGGVAQRIPGWDQLTSSELAHLRVERQEFERLLETEKDARLVHFDLPSKAKTVRRHPSGCLEVADGPIGDAPDSVSGYFVIEAESLDEAVEWAKMDRWLVGASEVRQIWD